MTAGARPVTAALLLALVSATPSQAQDHGDALVGHDFVGKVCAECHGVEKGYQPSPEPFAPTFEAIANTPGMSPMALSVFLQTPHATMPNLVFTATERAHIIAYITSLKKK
jgi:mono/diheme cytochrome c family protein